MRANCAHTIEHTVDGRFVQFEPGEPEIKHLQTHFPRLLAPGVLAPLVVAGEPKESSHLLAGVAQCFLQLAQILWGWRGVVD